MERKLIRLANKTLVASLPYEFVDRMNLKKGEGIEIIDKDNELVIRPKPKGERKIKEIDVKGCNERLIKRTISAAYKLGFEKFRILCDEDNAKFIEKLIEAYIGLIITEKEKNSLLIKNMTKSESEDFQPIFRKIFFIINSIASESLDAIRKKDKKKVLELIDDKENFNKQINLCIQILSRGEIGSVKETNVYFYVLSVLDMISDLYFRICQNYVSGHVMNKEMLELYLKVNKLFDGAYSSFFSDTDINKLYEIREDIFKGRKIEKSDSVIFAIIVKLILELIECRLMLNLLKE